MILEDWKDSGDFMDFKGRKIFYVYHKTPSRPTLLMLHGFPTSSWDWYKMWPGVVQHYACLAPDFLGFGFSDKPYPYSYSIIEQADIIEQLLRELEVAECYVIAHNYAVSVMQELLARRLEDNRPLFKKIILLNGGLFPETHHARPIQKLLLSRVGKLVTMLLSKHSLRKNLVRVFGPETPPTEQEIDEFWEIINHNEGKRVFHRLIHYMNDRKKFRERWLRALQHTSTPVKLVNGPEDPVSGIHLVERYRELIPRPDVHILDGIGHYPNVECPSDIVSIITNYFNSGYIGP